MVTLPQSRFRRKPKSPCRCHLSHQKRAGLGVWVSTRPRLPQAVRAGILAMVKAAVEAR